MKPTEEQIKRIKAENEERNKLRAAVFAEFPAATAQDIVKVARDMAWDILFADDAHDIATMNATAHTLATVMVALRAAGVSDSVA